MSTVETKEGIVEAFFENVKLLSFFFNNAIINRDYSKLGSTELLEMIAEI